MKRKFDNGFQYIIVCTGRIKTITSCDFNGWGYQYVLDNNPDFAIHEHELINRIKDGRFCIKE